MNNKTLNDDSYQDSLPKGMSEKYMTVLGCIIIKLYMFDKLKPKIYEIYTKGTYVYILTLLQ